MSQYLKTAGFLFLLLPLSVAAQLQKYSFEQLEDLQNTEKRDIVVFIHTDWCRYCQLMKNTTFKSENVMDLLNDNFWFVDLNAEEKRTIRFNNQIFRFKPSGLNTGVNELAEQLATIDGKAAYPTICILNPNNEIVFQYNEYINSDDLMQLLNEVLIQRNLPASKLAD